MVTGRNYLSISSTQLLRDGSSYDSAVMRGYAVCLLRPASTAAVSTNSIDDYHHDEVSLGQRTRPHHIFHSP